MISESAAILGDKVIRVAVIRRIKLVLVFEVLGLFTASALQPLYQIRGQHTTGTSGFPSPAVVVAIITLDTQLTQTKHEQQIPDRFQCGLQRTKYIRHVHRPRSTGPSRATAATSSPHTCIGHFVPPCT
jgi:hypothetical protein